MPNQPNNDLLFPKSLVLPHFTTTERDALVADVGTVIYNETTSKINFCKTKSAGAGSWEAVTSA